MFIVETHAGRLLEMSIASPFPETELNAFVQAVTAAVRKSSQPVVCCTDLRRCGVLAPAVSDRLTTMMRADNPRVERNAFIVGEGAVFSMQIERMLREAGSPSRRSFREAPHAEIWLADALTSPERERLRVLLK